MRKSGKIKRKDKSLKQFLNRRFILIILLLALSEGVISVLFSEFLYPFISKLLVFTDIKITNFSSGVLSNMTQVILVLIIICILSLLPSYLSEAMKVIFQRVSADVLQIRLDTKIPEQLGSPILVQLYYFGLLLLFLIILFVILLPYLVAALAFGRMVSKKVEGPIHRLTKGMEQVSEGKLDTRLTFETEHEFIQMRNTFNEMAEQMEQNAKDKIEIENRKNTLLSDIAHDLKTPITTISGYATALIDGLVKSPEKEVQYLEAIKAKSLRMDELIMLLFEYVKLDSVGFALSREKLDLAELLRENIALLYTDFETKKMEINMDIPTEAVNYEVDRIQFSRVIANLLNNAIRYNPEGSLVTIKLFVGDCIKIVIADNGAPIGEEIVGHIFEPFVTGDESRNTKSGSGLGLSIAKKVVIMHGGDLVLDHEINDEYTKAFVITLPI
ncbi:HAMP domain-containing sensor histidine kinase [[Clostridium] fimetarium]|uniref:histidine kinase n=1 Tax=[Clostridium] fimetarium TaxID=99656 RepID=A0A1I0R6Y3_9FIRM|nr:HAMP domain-containing sensor histidine kinase [[Clostridium] fimetarium]SEW36190.1 Signal transduction histidine kinase [[Clostridium] fimetarium]